MDRHALSVLEYPAIVRRLADAAASEPGAALARALEPSGDPAEVARRQALTAEAIALLESSAEPELHAVRDVREPVAYAARGGVLSTTALHDVAVTIRAAIAARALLETSAETAPGLGELAKRIDPALAGLSKAVERCVEEDGSGLRDTASARLRRLRNELREGRHRIGEELRRLARSSGVREHLQEAFVTERRGRPVLAVKASARERVPGVVHDASASGQTLFVEPLALVALTNRLSEAAGAEREEAERILAELSGQVGERAPGIRALVEAAAALDLALACGLLSRGWRGCAVQGSAEVRLCGVRHPLLEPASAVPIDLDLGLLRALVVSGPNTGGKTVALKTLGLAALLHQAGLRPPASAAELPVFDQVLADVGDEQSIERSLSTFSGHISNLVAILEAATDRSLVLVDELASGTDPVEGSALAQALVERLARQARLTLVTTHYPELKEWASAAEGVANAATALDPETDEPLYSLVIGRPGTSHALRTAARLGLDPGVVGDARARVTPERLRVAELLAEAEAAERGAAQAHAEAEEERDEAARTLERLAARESELERQIAAVRASAEGERDRAAAETRVELAEARAELEALRQEIRAARRYERERLRSGSQAPGQTERERDRRLGAASDRARLAELALGSVERPQLHEAPLAPGDPVEAPELGVRGTVAAIDGDEAEVVAGGVRVRIALARLRPDVQVPRHAPERAATRVMAPAAGSTTTETDVRGRTAQEAREEVRAFVDEAALAGLALVRVVHGRGTGALRAAVRDELARHPLVERHEPESADGATAVHL
ncbi:MAG: Smr/MutS family protein [Gaiellaceae bacterium]